MWYSFLQNYNFSTYTKTAIIAPTQIGHEHYTYDANGNPTLVENDSLGTERRMYWDEDNRLMVLSDNGKTCRYTYNAAGERIIKSHGDLEGVYINGAPQGITFHETEDYTIYPAPIITVTKNRFTKHYFIGDKRVASKLGVGKFSNVYGISGNNVTAGQKDYAARMMQIEKQREEYYKSLGTPPGVPTMKGATADPDNTGRGYNDIIGDLGDHSVPEGWVQHPKRNTTPGTPPGPPIQWGAPEDPDNAQPGYGYIPTDTTNTEDIFFYHSDHLGSTSYITDAKANITQFDAYLPYGELLVDEHSSSEDMPYKFNGKEMDAETGLYYYGARYMNPVTSLWYGVDALIEAKPSMAGNTYCLGNPINLTDPDGNWEWNKNGNLVAQKGDQATSLAKFLGTNIKNAMTILHRVGVKANKRDILNLKAGQVLNKKDLWVGFKAASGKVVHNTEEATRHYLHGHGESADVGDQSTLELLTSSKFREKHTKITSQVVAPQGYFSVDMTKKTFHIGNTNIDYSISNNGKSASVTYTLFARDGFWDPDFIDEKGLGKIPVINKLTHTIPDGMGPNLERFGGTPYHYKTRTRTYFFKPVQ